METRAVRKTVLKMRAQRGALARGLNGAEWSEWRTSARSQSGDLPGQGHLASNWLRRLARRCSSVVLTSDLIHSVNDGSGVTSNCHWSKVLGGEQKGQVSQDGSGDSEWIVSSVPAPLCENAPLAVVSWLCRESVRRGNVGCHQRGIASVNEGWLDSLHTCRGAVVLGGRSETAVDADGSGWGLEADIVVGHAVGTAQEETKVETAKLALSEWLDNRTTVSVRGLPNERKGWKQVGPQVYSRKR